MTRLDSLKWVTRWVSHLGCIEGCTGFLGVDISDAWLFGGTGHAFVLNIHEELCPSGPTAWNTSPLHQLGNGLGMQFDGVVANKRETGFAEAQRQAYDLVRDSIDQGLPCFGWELAIPEYHIVHGYDETGYYHSGPGCKEGGSGPKPWHELGDTGIGMLEMYCVSRSEPLDPRQVAKRAFVFALEHSVDKSRWVVPGYSAGLEAYDSWIAALHNRTADSMGTSYNSAVWKECRGFAHIFLEEARQKLEGIAGETLNKAISCYSTVHDQLSIVADQFPFFERDPAHVKDPARLETAINALIAARDAESAGLEALRAAVDEL